MTLVCVTVLIILQKCCGGYSVSSESSSDGAKPQKPISKSQTETSERAAPTTNIHTSSQTSVHGPPNARSYHTLARNRCDLLVQQQRCLKETLATDGSTLLTEASKSVASSGSVAQSDKTNTASNDSNINPELMSNAKKLPSSSGVSLFTLPV